jgi:uncharacterized membrane protein YeaQ/YmgE (transglycosylase-associated protein family)
MLFIGLILFGMLIGAGAQFIVGRRGGSVDWTMALVSGLVGSFVGGMIFSLVAGDGFELRASGIIGSLLGAVIVTLLWRWWAARSPTR